MQLPSEVQGGMFEEASEQVSVCVLLTWPILEPAHMISTDLPTAASLVPEEGEIES